MNASTLSLIRSATPFSPPALGCIALHLCPSYSLGSTFARSGAPSPILLQPQTTELTACRKARAVAAVGRASCAPALTPSSDPLQPRARPCSVPLSLRIALSLARLPHTFTCVPHPHEKHHLHPLSRPHSRPVWHQEPGYASWLRSLADLAGFWVDCATADPRASLLVL